MVVQQPVDAMTVGCTFAEMLRGEMGVRELWVNTLRDRVDLYLIVDAIDADAERHLYDLSGELYDVFPELRFQLFVHNPRFFLAGTDLRTQMPRGSRQVPLGD